MPPKPTTAVLLGPFAGKVGQPVLADPTQSKAAPGSTLKNGTIGWGDGDTTSWTGKPALESHVYQKAGSFTVVLTVWDTKGRSSTASASATIADAAAPSPTPAPTPVPPAPTPGGCTFSISPSSIVVDAVGRVQPVIVTANDPGCAWQAVSGASWLTPSKSGGTGTGSVDVVVAQNDGVAREQDVFIAGLVFHVHQDGLGAAPSPDPGPTPAPAPIPEPTPVPPPPAGPVVSPLPAPTSGARPRAIWTPERQAQYSAMWANYQANPTAPSKLGGQWMKQQVESAKVGGAPLSGSIVMTWLYQATGDPAYAQQAYTRFLLEFPANQGDDNFVREGFARYVITYEWLYQGLTQAQRDTYLSKLNQIATYVLGKDWRIDDSDQCTGTYLGIVLLYLLTGSYNPTAVQLYNKPFVGGLDATGTDRSTMRNAVKDFVVNLSAGGEWCESAEYNPGTTRLLIEGTEAIRTALGVDHFPEVTAWLQDAALRWQYMLTPDLKASIEWGDDENPRQMPAGRVWDYIWNLGTVAGVTQGTPNGPYAQDLLLASVAKWPLTAYNNLGSAIMVQPGMFFVNPDAPRADRTTLPKSKLMGGQGFLCYHDGWGPQDSLMALHILPGHRFVDHAPQFFADFQLYRKGEWAVTHPITYAGPPTNLGDGVNGMKFWDRFSIAEEYRKIRAHEVGTGPDFAYMSGTMGGQIAGEGTYDPPQTWMMEATRSYVYLPSPDKKSDTLVIFDRFNAKRPQDQAGFSGDFNFYYNAADRALINTKPLREQIFHMPVAPTSGAEVTWTTPGGQQVIVAQLLPSGATRTVVDEKVLFQGQMPVDEQKYQVRFAEAAGAAGAPWQTFLTVVQAHDGIARSLAAIQSADGTVQGVSVRRGGLNDAVLIFNATRGASLAPHTLDGAMRSVFAKSNQALLDGVRLRRTGYSVPVTTTTSASDLFLFDLDPSRAWTISVDGAPPAPLAVSSQGVARRVVSGIGLHTLVIA